MCSTNLMTCLELMEKLDGLFEIDYDVVKSLHCIEGDLIEKYGE